MAAHLLTIALVRLLGLVCRCDFDWAAAAPRSISGDLLYSRLVPAQYGDPKYPFPGGYFLPRKMATLGLECTVQQKLLRRATARRRKGLWQPGISSYEAAHLGERYWKN
jgi:hypothetical protein